MRLRNLFRPLYVAGRIQNWLYQKRHPDHPWLAPHAVVWLEANLRPDMRGFEWGSGRSTLWFGKRLKSLTSIESNAACVPMGVKISTASFIQARINTSR